MNWMQLEAYLEDDDRIVLPLGSTEQHAYLSLATDSILAERLSVDAAEPLGVPVLPALPYGLTPGFAAFPGSPSLRLATYATLLQELLESLYEQGFRRFLLVNGHGGNMPAALAVREWTADTPDAQARFHNWFIGTAVSAVVQEIDHEATHASWFENFPWTRLEGVELPAERKPLAEPSLENPGGVRELLGDGSYGGLYRRSDEEMMRVWEAGVAEVRGLLESGWRDD